LNRAASLPGAQAQGCSPERAEPLFRDLFDANIGLVWKVLRRLGVHERDLEDEAHEVFVVVHRRLDDYDVERPFRTWLLGICYRRAADYRRLSRHANETLVDPPEAPTSERTIEDHYAEREDWARLHASLDHLEDAERTAVVLHDLEGLPLREVAEIVGIPLQTVYSRIRSGRNALATLLGLASGEAGRS
jgi:RNA polymerase sigma-70 factor, ECF subfamily